MLGYHDPKTNNTVERPKKLEAEELARAINTLYMSEPTITPIASDGLLNPSPAEPSAPAPEGLQLSLPHPPPSSSAGVAGQFADILSNPTGVLPPHTSVSGLIGSAAPNQETPSISPANASLSAATEQSPGEQNPSNPAVSAQTTDSVQIAATFYPTEPGTIDGRFDPQIPDSTNLLDFSPGQPSLRPSPPYQSVDTLERALNVFLQTHLQPDENYTVRELLRFYQSGDRTQKLLSTLDQELARMRRQGELADGARGIHEVRDLLAPSELIEALRNDHLNPRDQADLNVMLSTALQGMLKPGETIANIASLATNFVVGDRTQALGQQLNQVIADWRESGRLDQGLHAINHWTQVLAPSDYLTAQANGHLTPTADAAVRLSRANAHRQLADNLAVFHQEPSLVNPYVPPGNAEDLALWQQRDNLVKLGHDTVARGISLHEAYMNPRLLSDAEWSMPEIQHAVRRYEITANSLAQHMAARYDLPAEGLEDMQQWIVENWVAGKDLHIETGEWQSALAKFIANFAQDTLVSIVTGAGAGVGGTIGTSLAPVAGTLLGAFGGGTTGGIMTIAVTRTLGQALLETGNLNMSLDQLLGTVHDDVTQMIATMTGTGAGKAAANLGPHMATLIEGATDVATEIALQMPKYRDLLAQGSSWKDIVAVIAQDAAVAAASNATMQGILGRLGNNTGPDGRSVNDVRVRAVDNLTDGQRQRVQRYVNAVKAQMDRMEAGTETAPDLSELNEIYANLSRFDVINNMADARYPGQDDKQLVNPGRLMRTMHQVENAIKGHETAATGTPSTSRPDALARVDVPSQHVTPARQPPGAAPTQGSAPDTPHIRSRGPVLNDNNPTTEDFLTQQTGQDVSATDPLNGVESEVNHPDTREHLFHQVTTQAIDQIVQPQHPTLQPFLRQRLQQALQDNWSQIARGDAQDWQRLEDFLGGIAQNRPVNLANGGQEGQLTIYLNEAFTHMETAYVDRQLLPWLEEGLGTSIPRERVLQALQLMYGDLPLAERPEFLLNLPSREADVERLIRQISDNNIVPFHNESPPAVAIAAPDNNPLPDMTGDVTFSFASNGDFAVGTVGNAIPASQIAESGNEAPIHAAELGGSGSEIQANDVSSPSLLAGGGSGQSGNGGNLGSSGNWESPEQFVRRNLTEALTRGLKDLIVTVNGEVFNLHLAPRDSVSLALQQHLRTLDTNTDHHIRITTENNSFVASNHEITGSIEDGFNLSGYHFVPSIPIVITPEGQAIQAVTNPLEVVIGHDYTGALEFWVQSGENYYVNLPAGHFRSSPGVDVQTVIDASSKEAEAILAANGFTQIRPNVWTREFASDSGDQNITFLTHSDGRIAAGLSRPWRGAAEVRFDHISGNGERIDLGTGGITVSAHLTPDGRAASSLDIEELSSFSQLGLTPLDSSNLEPDRYSEYEARMRPGQSASDDGFLGRNESLAELLAQDQQAVENLGVTHLQLASTLQMFHQLADLLEGTRSVSFEFNNQTFTVHRNIDWGGAVESPLDETVYYRSYFVVNETTGHELLINGVHPPLIARGFYQGEGRTHRIGPEELFNFLNGNQPPDQLRGEFDHLRIPR